VNSSIARDDQPAGGEDGRGSGYGQCPAPSSPHRLTRRPRRRAWRSLCAGLAERAVAVAGPAAPAPVAAGVQGGGGAAGAAARAGVGDAGGAAVPAAAGRAGVGGGFTPRPADPPSVEQVAQAVDWAVQPLWDSADVLALEPPPRPAGRGTAIADAKARLAAASERLVLEAGRDTIIDNVERDRKAKAWARVPEPGACSFCADAGHPRRRLPQRAADFKSHDNCRCHVEPVFTAYEPPAKVREWQQQYDKVAEQIGYGTDGRVSAKDMRRAFRQSFEGRPVDVTPTQGGRADAGRGPRRARRPGKQLLASGDRSAARVDEHPDGRPARSTQPVRGCP
jgi:hypothetical protein